MKKTIISLAFIVLTVFAANAHPAKKVNLTYQNGKLTIEAIHKVADSKKHFIDQIVISVDGKNVKTIPIKLQSSTASEVYELEIDLKKGAKVEVSARCNILGVKKSKLIVE